MRITKDLPTVHRRMKLGWVVDEEREEEFHPCGVPLTVYNSLMSSLSFSGHCHFPLSLARSLASGVLARCRRSLSFVGARITCASLELSISNYTSLQTIEAHRPVSCVLGTRIFCAWQALHQLEGSADQTSVIIFLYRSLSRELQNIGVLAYISSFSGCRPVPISCSDAALL
jgi:hypothetical protein